MPGKSNRIAIKRLMQMDVSVFFVYFVAVNQGVINSCRFLKNGPLCGPLTFDRSPNMVRRNVCMSTSFFAFAYAHRKFSFILVAH